MERSYQIMSVFTSHTHTYLYVTNNFPVPFLNKKICIASGEIVLRCHDSQPKTLTCYIVECPGSFAAELMLMALSWRSGSRNLVAVVLSFLVALQSLQCPGHGIAFYVSLVLRGSCVC